MILKGAEPFLLPGGPQGVLLIHGFTGSPAEMLLLGKFLHDQGFTVLGVRLAGHGTTPEDLAHMRGRDWLHSVLDGYAMLKGCCRTISVVGLSMGALLAMLLSLRCHVEKIVSCSAPVFVAAEKNLHLLPSRKESAGQYIPKQKRRLKGIPECCNVYYHKMPLASVHELLAVIERMKEELPQVTQPLLIVQGREDHTVQPQSAEYIYERVGTEYPEVFWLEKSGHIVTLDCEHEKLFTKIAAFLLE